MEFLVPWLVIAAAVLGAGSAAVWFYRKRPTPVLFCLAGALFLFAGSVPTVSVADTVEHVIVIDVSDSMKTRLDRTIKDVQDYAKEPRDNVKIRVMYFNDSLHENIVPVGGRTLSQALPNAEALKINGDVVVITDGYFENSSMPKAGVTLVKAAGAGQLDAAILKITAPSVVQEGSNILLTATVRSNTDADVDWVLSGQIGEIASGKSVMKAGLASEVTASILVKEAGIQRYRLTVKLAGDVEPRNNVAEFAVTVAGKRVIHYAVQKDIPPQTDGLLSMLRADAANKIILTNQLPVSQAQLESIHMLVINNVAASTASAEQLQRIADWVRKGGAIFMAGTNAAFGPGGYRGTPIEDVLPVKLMPEDEPGRTVLLALDMSSSMAEGNKLIVLKQAAYNLLDSLGAQDRVAVAGFSSGFAGDIHYSNPAAQVDIIANLSASGSTDIGLSLAQALDSLQSMQTSTEPQKRLLFITDGKDESATQAGFRELAQRCSLENTKLDVILTGQRVPDWLELMRGTAHQSVNPFSADGDDFGSLLETLDRALRGHERRLISNKRMEVAGIGELNRFVRTAKRKDVFTLLEVETPFVGKPIYPLLAYRKLVGVSAVLTTDTWGADQEIWFSPNFHTKLQTVLSEVMAGAGRPKLELRNSGDDWSLHWIGLSEPPTGNLTIKDQMACQLMSKGVWSLAKPPIGESILVYSEAKLLQRIPISKPIDQELAYIGNNEAFFTAAENSGFTVLNNLKGLKLSEAKNDGQMNVTWIPSLLAMIALLAGFALRSRK